MFNRKREIRVSSKHPLTYVSEKYHHTIASWEKINYMTSNDWGGGGEPEYRSKYLSHTKRALYHLR